MLGTVEAYDRLLDLAGRGTPFRNDQITNPPRNPKEIFGVGHDFETTLTVPDIAEGKTVDATAKLRVIKRPSGALYLCSWLTWTPSDGQEHKSFAKYEITREAAEWLAAHADDPEPEVDIAAFEAAPLDDVVDQTTELLADTYRAAARFAAEWEQTHPGSATDMAERGLNMPDLSALAGIPDGDFEEVFEGMQTVLAYLPAAIARDPERPGSSDEPEDESEPVDPEFAVLQRHAEYHTRVIDQLADADTPVICMLSLLDVGAVGAEELPTLYGWVSERLDATQLV